VRRGRFTDYYRLRLPTDLSIEDAVHRFSSCSEVGFAEPNYLLYVSWMPNDPYYWSSQWNLQRSGVLDMQLAWELTSGSSSVTVAVVDAGVAYEDYDIPSSEQGQVYSPDGRYHHAPDLVSTQFVQGYDCVNDDDHPNDEHGHGTHVAGTIAQSTDNGLGVAGMAFGCRIMPVRVANQYGQCTETDVADGIAYAWQNGANVINMSLGSPYPDSSHLQHLSIIDAVNAGCVVVASAGNDGVGHVGYPAAFPECIVVGAVDWWWQMTPYSNWGAALDVVAPGGDTRTQNYWPITQNTYAEAGGTPPINVSTFGYLEWQGTSMAAPHVSALVAMMMSRGIRDPGEIKARLFGSAIDLGVSGWDTLYGYGLIEPVAALGGQSSFLQYDNGDPDNYWYINNGSERRVAVYFSPDLSAPFDVTEGSVLLKDNGGAYSCRLTLNPSSGGWPDMNTNLAGPVTFTTVGDADNAHWYTWDFAPVQRSSSAGYFLVFHWVSPDFGPPYIGGDTTNIASRSYIYSSSGWSRTYTQDWYLRTILLKDTLTLGVAEDGHPVAPVYAEGISQVVPQPARRSVRIIYNLARSGGANVQVFDGTGRVVRSLTVRQNRAGTSEFLWDGVNDQGGRVASGVYFIQLTTTGARYRARIVLTE
jgi:serine protease